VSVSWFVDRGSLLRPAGYLAASYGGQAFPLSRVDPTTALGTSTIASACANGTKNAGFSKWYKFVNAYVERDKRNFEKKGEKM